MVASSEGGMNIEEVAKEKPNSILKDPIDITKGTLTSSMLDSLIFFQVCHLNKH